jgi:hypothetical protein
MGYGIFRPVYGIFEDNNKKSLITSIRYQRITMMLATKHGIAVASFILATLIYSSSPTFLPHVEGKPVWGANIDCKEANFFYETCCWAEDFGTYIAYVCQTCYDKDGYGSNGYEDCGPLVKQRTISGDEVRAPLGEGVLEQPLTTTEPTTPKPPAGGKGIFGSDVLPTPSISPEGDVSNDGGTVKQPPTTPIAPPTGPTVAPHDSQGDKEDGIGDGGGVRPPLRDSLPEIVKEPGVQQPEQEEEPSNEGQDTAGPLT